MQHPSDFISAPDRETIQQYAAAAEEQGLLHKAQLELIYKNRWFNLFVPHQYGGLELTLPEALKIEEGLAYADGSTGWTVTLCSGANWFVGFLEQEVATAIFSNEKVCFAGSGRPTGRAKMLEDGYEIDGCWRYATGAPHASIFTANCMLEKDGIILTDEDGHPQIAPFWFYKEEVAIDKNWHTQGMIATASESFSIKNLIVPANRRFLINNSTAVLKQPVYQYPFLQFAEATLSVNISGMAMRFLDLFHSFIAQRQPNKYADEKSLQKLETRCTLYLRMLQKMREDLYQSVQVSWDELPSGMQSAGSLQHVSEACRTLAVKARKMTEDIYPFAGLAAADPSTEINRVWRNMHTASQHSLLNFPVTEIEK